MKLTLCLLAALVAMSLAPVVAVAANQPLLLCPIGHKATPVYDSNGKIVTWVCVKR